MANITATVNFTNQTFPAGTTISSIQATLLSGAAPVGSPVVVDPVGRQAVFTNVADGIYTVSVQAYDGANKPLSTAVVSNSVTINTTVTLSVPSAVSAAQG